MHFCEVNTARLRPLLIVFLLAFVAAQGYAQASAAGHITLNGALLRPAVDTFYKVDRTDTTAILIQSLAPVSRGARPAWLQVFKARGKNYEVVDSIEMDGRTLLPIAEARHTSYGNVRLRYDGSSVREILTPSGEAARTSMRALAGVVYSSSTLDAIARVLPLDRMGSLSVMMYYPFPAKVGVSRAFYTLAGPTVVLDRHRLAIPCWSVDFTVADVSGRTRFYVSKATRAIVQFETTDGVIYQR